MADRIPWAGRTPYIIAEIGVNHGGDFGVAHRLIDAAKDAGADAVKFQAFDADKLISDDYPDAERARETMRALSLSDDALAALCSEAHTEGLDAIVSVFHVGGVPPGDWDALKVASPDCVNTQLIDYLVSLNKPLIISTGAATMEEAKLCWFGLIVPKALERTAWLHCVSSYGPEPAPLALGGIQAMIGYGFDPVGHSYHGYNPEAGSCAVIAGATILEAHICESMNAGPDVFVSMYPDAFGAFVRFAHTAAAMVGLREKVCLPCEEATRELARQGPVAVRDLKAGERIRADDFTLKRPGGALEDFHVFDRHGNRVMKRDVKANRRVHRSDWELVW